MRLARGIAGGAAVVALAAGVALGSAPADAAEPSVALLAQAAWTPLDGDVTLKLDVPPSDLPSDEAIELRLRVHTRLTSFEAFERTTTGDDGLGGRVGTLDLPLAALPRDAAGATYVTFGLRDSPTTPRIDVARAGVYPLEVALRGDDTLASFVTWIVVTDPGQPPPPAVRLAVAWELGGPPVRDVDGVADPAAVAELAPGGRLATAAALLAGAPAVPVTLALTPETLESWLALAATDPGLAEGATRLESTIERATTQLLPRPYVGIDATSLEAAGLGPELSAQLVAGSDTFERLAGVTPDPRNAFVDPIDGAALARLRGLLVDRVLVRERALADPPSIDEPEAFAPFSVEAGEGTVRAVATNTAVENMLRGSAPPALRAQRTLAALALLAYETDLDDPPRGVVVVPPSAGAPDVELYAPLLAALDGHPLIEPVTLDGLFAQVPAATDDDGGAIVRDLAPIEPAAFPVTGAEYDAARAALGSLRSSVGDGDPDVIRGERALVLALSSEQDAGRAATTLGVIDDAVRRLTGGVSTARKRVTVTARRADVPLSFSNDTGKPLRVRVRLESTKLLFPDGSDHVVELPEGISTHRFAVEARASGTFVMAIAMESADGRLRIGVPTRVTVRSAVFSGVGTALTIGALGFLALWWGNHVRRTRRARHAAPAP